MALHRPQGDCWIWQGKRTKGGHGLFHSLSAHRFAFACKWGRLPVWPYVIMHECYTKACVNPAHLKEGHQRENRADEDMWYIDNGIERNKASYWRQKKTKGRTL